MININEFIQEVHENAVAHGFWEGKEKTNMLFCLIHSEWSEALEEIRQEHPMIWHECKEATIPCESRSCDKCFYRGNSKECSFMLDKPEGFAVEMIDGIIRICDLLGHVGYESRFETFDDLISDDPDLEFIGKSDEFALISFCHESTVLAHTEMLAKKNMNSCITLECIISIIWMWLKLHGIIPEEVLLEKHEYNKKRPYKHGKAF